MENRQCVNDTLVIQNYASPVPVIGLYVVGASVACMIMMIYDIVMGFRAKKRWLPCKSFILDSLTLTLLAVAAKLPVDLTTPMPSRWDQLSKLSATTLVCVCMTFLMPSLGLKIDSGSYTNLVSMSIFVITLIVNISIQISTGVIVLFVPEHIIILSCMLLLLVVLWFSYWDIVYTKKVLPKKEIYTKGEESMFSRLMESYLHKYRFNPQLIICRNSVCAVSSIACVVCCGILLYVAFRSPVLKELKFCSGESDYGWSMSAIVISQILTVIVGTFAVIFRCLALSKYMQIRRLPYSVMVEEDEIDKHPILRNVLFVERCWNFLVVVVQFIIVVLPGRTVRFVWLMADADLDQNSDKWVEKKLVEDIEASKNAIQRTIQKTIYDRDLRLLQEMIISTRPGEMDNLIQCLFSEEDVKVFSLSLVLLLKVIQFSSGSRDSERLTRVYFQVRQVIYFVDHTLVPRSLTNSMKLKFAKDVWDNLSTVVLPECTSDPLPARFAQLKSTLPNHPMCSGEADRIIDLICEEIHGGFQNFHVCAEKLFAEIIYEGIRSLPVAIYNSLINCSAEEYQEKLATALQYLGRVQSVEEYIQWYFPGGSNISSLYMDRYST